MTKPINKTIFARDEKNLTLTAKRTFNAQQSRVWQAYTIPELLEKWWAPAPWQATTVSMDFRIGGRWHYCMNGPEGEKHYGLMKYTDIRPEEYFASEDCFVDAEATVDPTLPCMKINNSFEADGEQTHLASVTIFASLKDMEKLLEMGAQDGFSTTLDQLETLLLTNN